MKKSKKSLGAWIMLGILLVSSMPHIAFARDEKPKATPYYIALTQQVKEVTVENGRTHIALGEKEVTAYFNVADSTYLANGAEIKAGDTITGYCKANVPMIMIYPPRYTPDVIVVQREGAKTIHADYFDENYVSSDGTLRLDPKTIASIKYQDGRAFPGDCRNRKLVVTYQGSTKSIPAIPLSPEVIVLGGDVPPVEPTPIEQMGIVVNGEPLAGARAYADGQGPALLPLRAIAEALGLDVTWQEATQTILLDETLRLQIDQDSYTYLNGTPISLGTAPKLVVDTTYVPFSFFDKVIELPPVEIVGNQIIVG